MMVIFVLRGVSAAAARQIKRRHQGIIVTIRLRSAELAPIVDWKPPISIAISMH
jgi:hypothetical protein